MVSQQKQNLVKYLTDIFVTNKNFAFIKYDKTTHQALEKLRRDLKKSDSKLKVVKNSLLEKAIDKIGTKDPSFLEFKKKFFPLKDSTAVLALGSEWSSGLKSFYEFAQKDQSLEFRGGFIDKELYPKELLERISTLPSKKELTAKLIGQFQTPLVKLVYSMKFNVNTFVYILQQKSKKS
ncbi:50S ribosomal protein L10 [Candidatus Roizmanbacteria bacterium]|nr:50S ribosomal protein L10 [Candidatus Roizmanbacteria bacterium]